ncbi:MAG: DUF4418 family protein [Candidatus Bathyarchaeota archaeon]
MAIVERKAVGFGIAGIVLGIIVAILPYYLLPVCGMADPPKMLETARGMFVPMKCSYMAGAEVALGSMIALVGAVLIVTRTSDAKRWVSFVGIILGIFVILVPWYLIGACMTPTMPCVVGTRPGLTVMGVLVIIVNVVGMWMLGKEKKEV